MGWRVAGLAVLPAKRQSVSFNEGVEAIRAEVVYGAFLAIMIFDVQRMTEEAL